MLETLKNFGGKKIGGLILIAVIIIAFGFGGFGGGFSTNNQNNIAKINRFIMMIVLKKYCKVKGCYLMRRKGEFKLKNVFLVSSVMSFILHASLHAAEAPLSSGALTILNLVADNPAEYAASQRDNVEIFEDLGITWAGACTAVSGNESLGEMQFFSFLPSVADAFSMWETMATSSAIREIQEDYSTSRRLLNNETWQIVDGYEGELMETWATRVVEVNPTNSSAYISAIYSLENAYYENGFNDIEFDIYQPIASGMQSLYNVVVVAPSLRRLGEVFDALSAESWAQEAYSLVTLSRPSLVSDKAYLCEQVYSSL